MIVQSFMCIFEWKGLSRTRRISIATRHSINNHKTVREGFIFIVNSGTPSFTVYSCLFVQNFVNFHPATYFRIHRELQSVVLSVVSAKEVPSFYPLVLFQLSSILYQIYFHRLMSFFAFDVTDHSDLIRECWFGNDNHRVRLKTEELSHQRELHLKD